MDINLSRDTRILIQGSLGAEFETTLGEIGRSRGNSVRHFIEVSPNVIDEAIKCYREDELRAERAELMRKVRLIDKKLNEDGEYPVNF